MLEKGNNDNLDSNMLSHLSKSCFENTSIFSELKKIQNLDKYVYDSVGKRAANYGSSS
jgi:hypothetical protein